MEILYPPILASLAIALALGLLGIRWRLIRTHRRVTKVTRRDLTTCWTVQRPTFVGWEREPYGTAHFPDEASARARAKEQSLQASRRPTEQLIAAYSMGEEAGHTSAIGSQKLHIDAHLAKLEPSSRADMLTEPIAWTTRLALETSKNLAGTPYGVIDACAVNIWGENGVPLYAREPSPGGHLRTNLSNR